MSCQKETKGRSGTVEEPVKDEQGRQIFTGETADLGVSAFSTLSCCFNVSEASQLEKKTRGNISGGQQVMQSDTPKILLVPHQQVSEGRLHEYRQPNQTGT